MAVANTYLVSKQFHVESAKEFANSVVSDTNAYYVFASKCTPYTPSDSSIPNVSENIQSMKVDLFDQMIFGKRIRSVDVMPTVKRYDWETGTIFSKYDSDSTTIFEDPFYCVVNAGSTYHVYKCIDNNGGVASTVEPSGTGIIYSPTDGYAWIHIYSVEETTFLKFATNNYMPVMSDASVVANTTPGTIEHIEITEGGYGYENHYQSEFRADDVRFGSNPSVTYALQEDASSTNDFYNGCVIKITSGAAEGEYRIITDYEIVGGKKQITINEPFTSPAIPQATDTYEVNPFVIVYGDGTETVNCDARAIVSNTDVITSIEILNSGENYRNATATIIPSVVVPVEDEVVLRPIVSPKYGHGSDPVSELGANRVSVVVKFNFTEGGWIPIENDYRTIGLLKDPLFQNIRILTDPLNTKGSFINQENVYQYRPIVLEGDATVDANSAFVTGSGLSFNDAVVPGDKILIQNNIQNYFTEVKTIFSNTYIECVSSSPAAISNGTISIVKTNDIGTIDSSTLSSITISNLASKSLTADRGIIGETSHATTVVDTTETAYVTMNGREINSIFETFVNMNRLEGTKTSIGVEFEEDELVVLSGTDIMDIPETAAVGVYHSTTEDGDLYLSEVRNSFSVGDTVVGVQSGATFEISNKYNGDLVKDSGKILYVENLSPISRASNRSETIRLILEF